MATFHRMTALMPFRQQYWNGGTNPCAVALQIADGVKRQARGGSASRGEIT